MIEQIYNLEAEQAVLGTILTHNEALVQLVDLRVEHFYDPVNQMIFEEAQECIQNGRVANPVTIMKNLAGRAKGLDSKYLAKLAAASAVVANVSAYGKIIIDLSCTRILRGAALRVLNSPNDSEIPELAAILTNALDDSLKNSLSNKLRSGFEVRTEIIESFNKNNPSYKTGLNKLDIAMGGGLQEGRFYSFSADSGHGKTMMATTISNNLKNSGVKHLYICAEMGDNETHSRSIAKDIGAYTKAFYDKDMRDEEFFNNLGNSPSDCDRNVIYYSDPFLTFDTLKHVISVAVTKHKIKGFILDYWQLVGGNTKRVNESTFLGEVAQWQAAACKRWNLWAINTAQLNRDGFVLGSGGLQRAVDQMYFIHRPDVTQPYAWVEMKKSRHTKFMNLGSAEDPRYIINERGGFFEEI